MHGASALGGAQRAPPSSRAGTLMRFNAPRGIDRCATPQRRPLQIILNTQSQWVKGCRGRCLHRPVKPLLCKGRWHGVSRDGGIGARMGVLGCTRKATIPQSALSRSQPFGPGPLCRCATSPHTVGSHPLHKGAFNSTPVEFIWPRRGQCGKSTKRR